jgi:hypothetical protein
VSWPGSPGICRSLKVVIEGSGILLWSLFGGGERGAATAGRVAVRLQMDLDFEGWREGPNLRLREAPRH